MTNSVSCDAERLRRPAVCRTLELGDLRVSYVPDGAVQLHPRRWFPASTDEVWAAHPEYLDDTGNLVASIGGLLVERGERALLIDAGFGPGRVAAQPDEPHGEIYGGALLDNLARLGREPASIEAVAFTHLHVDHLGWAWQPVPGTGQPVFTGARYLVAEPEWSGRELLAAYGTTEKMLSGLEPRVRTVSDGEEIFPGVRVLAAPGHTPGHTAYLISSAGQRLIAFGDALHSPIQIDHPQWSAAVDHDPELAAIQRRRLVVELAEPGTIGYGVHFADVVFGTTHPDGSGLAWRPLD